MKEKYLGRLIRYHRKKKDITIENLASGICSVSELKRMIRGEKLSDFFVMERVFERLSLSVNKIEILQNEEEYCLLCIRECVERYLEKKEYGEVEKCLKNYESLAGKEECLHLQYFYKIRGILAFQKEKNREEAERLFQLALECTVKAFSPERMDSYVLGEEEMILLILCFQAEGNNKKTGFIENKDRLLAYIKKNFTDEEVKANIFSKMAWILGERLIESGTYEEALEITLKGEEILASNALLIHIPQFLERIVGLMERLDKTEVCEWKKQRDALKELYLEYEEGRSDSINLWESDGRTPVYLLSEFLKDKRKLEKKSQEEFAEEIEIDSKTVSRIERGKCSVKRGTYEKIKSYLELEDDYIKTKITVEDFYQLELEREIAKNCSKREYELAESQFEKLISGLSMDYLKNRQYKEFMEAVFDLAFGRKTVEEMIEKLERAFLITRKREGIENLGRFVTTKLEAHIINLLSVCYKKLGEGERGIELLEKLIKGYENSRVDTKHHYVSLGLAYANLCGYYEEENRFVEALKQTDKAIKYVLRCGRGNHLGYLIEEKAYILDRMEENHSKGKLKYRQSYQLMKLMKNSRADKKSLEEAYKTWYGEEIE